MSNVPLREPTFLVLTALAAEPRHGYAVIEDVAQMTGGRLRLRAGTLYTALDRLRQDGLIEVDREEVVQSRLRRYYRLTGAGERTLAAETARLREQATIAERRLKVRRTNLGGATA
ncbi:PadR family transcriptional regulator [Actinoplanes sp. SE50]|uniref:PadR family transcriptional regulator n=1 Tax=unclassified Actinoplanes TaxID=2626549 RepID=UPI00023EE02E|nr:MULTISPECIES: PadR family transcriptional regulator [unclassified Actinoplanes]AEV88400.1 transcriptional regulator, PadR-like family [Actinoplanes sp. SE50/110]ATO86805.1 PadR family transcriptional regulator [Actinoplanes sp. SE50]SLM04223.1 PadR family transcriptional regulator [Actinoplanes sp. SE50/110]